jgi:hypothetical protein
MHNNEFGKIRNFLIRYKFYIKFVGTKIWGKICREKNFDKFYKTLSGSNIGMLVFILEEN